MCRSSTGRSPAPATAPGGVPRSAPQYRHRTAASWICSAQYGQGFIAGPPEVAPSLAPDAPRKKAGKVVGGVLIWAHGRRWDGRGARARASEVGTEPE